MSTVHCHAFSILFQLFTRHGVLEKYFQIRYTNEQNHYGESSQLETVEHVLKECSLHPAEWDLLKKVSLELGYKILLGTKKSFGVVFKFLDSLLQILVVMVSFIRAACQGFTEYRTLVLIYLVSCIKGSP